MAAPAAYSRRSFVGNAAATTVPLGLSASASSCTLASATNWPSGSGGDFLVVIDRGLNTEEVAWSSGVSGSTLTFAARGAQGTSAIIHAAGCTIALSVGAQDLDEANQVVAAVLGQSGAAKGDIPVILSAAGPNTLTRVPIGTSPAVLGVAAGLPAWETPVNGYGIAGFAANPMTPAVSLSYVESYISGSTIGLSASTPTNLTSVSLAAGTWHITARAQVQGTAATVGAFDLWIGPNSASTTGAYAGDSADIANLAGGTEQITVTVTKVVVLGSPTTVYLNAESSQVSTVQYQGQLSSAPNATGITALRVV